MSTTLDMTVSRCILLVEQHDDTCEVLTSIFELYGHKVQCANTVEKALLYARQFCPDAALISLDYGDYSGFLLCKQLRAMPEVANCLIIGLSTYHIAEGIDVTDTAGFDEIVLKPMDTNRFIKQLEELH